MSYLNATLNYITFYHVFYSFLQELSDTGSPMLDENKFNIRGILCHVPDNMLLTIFIDTQVFLPWIEAAKRNEQFQSLGRKFLMRPIG